MFWLLSLSTYPPASHVLYGPVGRVPHHTDEPLQVFISGIHLQSICVLSHSAPVFGPSSCRWVSRFPGTLTSCDQKVEQTVHVHAGLHPWTDRRRKDLVSKPPFVLEPRGGSDEQMWKQCSHQGEAVTEAAITDSVDLGQQSQSAYCLCDICFSLYKIQMGLELWLNFVLI